MDFDPCQAWYHGSPHKFTALAAGSTITQNHKLARVFSHKPTIVSVSDEGIIKHNGTMPGYLYIVSEEVQPEDVIQHPHSTMQEGEEWLTMRELAVHLLTPTEIRMEEMLTDEELTDLITRTNPHP